MTEYIGWIDDDWNTVLDQNQPIVRCRDCRYYDEIIHACERFDSIKQDNVSYVFDGDFCAWGERREKHGLVEEADE